MDKIYSARHTPFRSVGGDPALLRGKHALPESHAFSILCARSPAGVCPSQTHSRNQHLLYLHFRCSAGMRAAGALARIVWRRVNTGAAKPCHHPTYLADYVKYAPKALRHHVAWMVGSQWTREATRPEISRGRVRRRPSTKVATELTVRGAQPIWTPAAAAPRLLLHLQYHFTTKLSLDFIPRHTRRLQQTSMTREKENRTESKA